MTQNRAKEILAQANQWGELPYRFEKWRPPHRTYLASGGITIEEDQEISRRWEWLATLDNSKSYYDTVQLIAEGKL